MKRSPRSWRVHRSYSLCISTDPSEGDAYPDDVGIMRAVVYNLGFLGFQGGFCLTYFLSGTRDFLLSSTVLLHRAVHRAGVKAELHVFEAMSHGFNIMAQLPEA